MFSAARRSLGAAVLSLALSLGAHAQRTAEIQIRNSTGAPLRWVRVLHMSTTIESASYKNDIVFLNVPVGVSAARMKVVYSTAVGIVDRWNVSWMTDRPDNRLDAFFWYGGGTPEERPDCISCVQRMSEKLLHLDDIIAGNGASLMKQHNLSASDAGRVTIIEVRRDHSVAFISSSGTSTTNSQRDAAIDDLQFTASMAAVGDALYIVRGSRLWRMRPTTGEWTALDSGPVNGRWPNASAMTEYGGQLYIVAGDNLYRVDPSTGQHTHLVGQGAGGWQGVAGMTGTADGIFIITGNHLYRADPATGIWSARPGQAAGGWPATAAVTSTAAGIFLVTQDQLYNANPADGMWSPRSGQARGGWPITAAMTSLDGQIYIVTNGQLYHADPNTGTWSPRPGQAAGAWVRTEAMTSMGGALYIVQDRKLHRVDPTNGMWQVLPGPGT